MRPQPQIEEPLFRVRYDERPIERYAECMEMIYSMQDVMVRQNMFMENWQAE